MTFLYQCNKLLKFNNQVCLIFPFNTVKCIIMVLCLIKLANNMLVRVKLHHIFTLTLVLP